MRLYRAYKYNIFYKPYTIEYLNISTNNVIQISYQRRADFIIR